MTSPFTNSDVANGQEKAVITDYEHENALHKVGLITHIASVTHAFRGILKEVTTSYYIFDERAPQGLVDSTGTVQEYFNNMTAGRAKDLFDPVKSMELDLPNKVKELPQIRMNRHGWSWMVQGDESTPNEKLTPKMFSGVTTSDGTQEHPVGHEVHIATVTHAWRGVLKDVTPSAYVFDERYPVSVIDSTGAIEDYLASPKVVHPGDTHVPNAKFRQMRLNRGAWTWMVVFDKKA